MSHLIPKDNRSSDSFAVALQTPLTLESQVEIDRVCTDFEERWGTDLAVSIEQVITSSPEKLRPAIFHQLLLIELELGGAFNQFMDEPDYLNRFPEFAPLIKTVFLESNLVENTVENNPLASNNRYILQTELARGGMGVVYRGWDSVLKRQIAIKVIDAGLMQDREASLRFCRESRLCGNLQHPNIIPVYDVGRTESGLDFFVMKLINGRTLDEWLQHESPSTSFLPNFQIQAASQVISFNRRLAIGQSSYQCSCKSLEPSHRRTASELSTETSNRPISCWPNMAKSTS